MQETRVQSLGQEGNGNLLQYSCLQNPMSMNLEIITLSEVINMCVDSAQLCPTLCDSTDQPGSTVHIIFQARKHRCRSMCGKKGKHVSTVEITKYRAGKVGGKSGKVELI